MYRNLLPFVFPWVQAIVLCSSNWSCLTLSDSRFIFHFPIRQPCKGTCGETNKRVKNNNNIAYSYPFTAFSVCCRFSHSNVTPPNDLLTDWNPGERQHSSERTWHLAINLWLVEFCGVHSVHNRYRMRRLFFNLHSRLSCRNDDATEQLNFLVDLPPKQHGLDFYNPATLSGCFQI